jgi:hypothetical protein
MLDWLLGTKEERQHKAEIKHLEAAEDRAGATRIADNELESLDAAAHQLANDMTELSYHDAATDYRELWQDRARIFRQNADTARLAVFEKLDRDVVAPVLERKAARAQRELEQAAREDLEQCQDRGENLSDPEVQKYLRQDMMERASEQYTGKINSALAEHAFDHIIGPRIPGYDPYKR